MDCCHIGSNGHCRGEEGAKPDGETIDLKGDLCSIFHLWSRALCLDGPLKCEFPQASRKNLIWMPALDASLWR